MSRAGPSDVPRIKRGDSSACISIFESLSVEVLVCVDVLGERMIFLFSKEPFLRTPACNALSGLIFFNNYITFGVW